MKTAAGWVLGVDFGAVNTAAALRDPSGRVSELRLSSAEVSMPSAVWCTDQQLLVGESALKAGLRDPGALELYPKCLLGTHTANGNMTQREHEAYVADSVAAVLSHVLGRTRDVTGGDLPHRLVLTYPDVHRATFSESSQFRDGLQQAADLLAWPSCCLVPESMAVARFVETEAQLVAPALLVLNFGAVRCGAVVLMQQHDGSYAPVAARSVDRLGGFALEDDVRNWALRSLDRAPEPVVPALGERFPNSRMRMDLPIRDAISALALATSADIEFNGRADPTVLRLTRDRFDALSRRYVDAAVQLTREMLAAADELKNSSSGTVIILTGAAARNRTLRARIAGVGFVADFGDPATLIARGAAYHTGPSSTSDVSAGGGTQAGDMTGARRLRARVTRGGRVCKRSLSPHREHQLEVWLAGPAGSGDTAEESAVDDEEPVELVVDVCSDDGADHGTASLFLPMRERSRASSVAIVKFFTGDDRSTLRLNITVLGNGRPIQAAVLQAGVRAERSWPGRISLSSVPLSAAPEPRQDAVSAEATVECAATTLKRLGRPDRTEIPLSAVQDISTVMAEAAAKVLSGEDAPATLDHPAAVRLLVNLARLGRQLADTLAELGLADARTIAMTTRPESPVIPLELAYDGVAPEASAQLCGCVSDPITKPAVSHASPQTVCPYAFWGMNRLILRTVGGEPVQRLPERPPLSALSLRPVVYGAADDADERGLPWDILTKRVEDVLSGRAGRRQFTRVSGWHAWRRCVQRVAPELLVVLCNSEVRRGTVNLVIGKRSRLAPGAVSAGKRSLNAPVVLLCTCRSNTGGDAVGAFPGAFIDAGAVAVIATLTAVGGPAAAQAATALVQAMHSNRTSRPTLAAALSEARRRLIAQMSPAGLLLIAHGEIDIPLAVGVEPEFSAKQFI